MKFLVALGLSAALLTANGLAAEQGDVDFVVGSSLPPDVWEALSKGNAYAVEARINPFYLQGDFDGDGWRDTAVLVKERASG